MKVAPGVHRIEASLGERYIASYVLHGRHATMIIDTGLDGTARDWLLPALGELHIDPAAVRYVLSTHSDYDHTGGNAAMREAAPRAVFLAGVPRVPRAWHRREPREQALHPR